MENLLEKLNEATAYIQSKAPFKPEYGIILGTGLGNLIGEMDIKCEVEYEHIPHFPVSTVESHSGRLLFGYIGDKAIVAMQGRFHYYEGYSQKEITFPVRTLKLLGVNTLFVSNAAGSLNPDILKGTLMIIDDHINLQPGNPLIGKNYDELGIRFPDMSAPYDKELIAKAETIVKKHNINCTKGVYISVPGPNLETRAEYRYLRTIGGDAVGMSTVPEVIVANHMKMKVFAISVVTDEGFHKNLKEVTIEEVIAAANIAEPKMTLILKELIASL